MPDDDQDPETGPAGQALVHDPVLPAAEVTGGRTTDLVVQRAGRPATEAWRRRVLAVRTGLPLLARNPVVVGVSTVAATVAARIAVDLVRSALGGPGRGRPAAVAVTGRVVADVRVVHRVDVVHHVVHHVTHQVVEQVVRPGLPPSPGR